MNIDDKYCWMGEANKKNKRIFTLVETLCAPLFDLYKLQDEFGVTYDLSPSYIEANFIKIARRKITWATK